MVEELKPWVDRKYRTLDGPAHTGVGGSSLGGLVSLYLGLTWPQVFGRLAVLSPSVWWARGEMLHDDLRFPFNQRWLMWFWNILYNPDRRFAPDPAKSAAWNRGAYLVEALGHCGDCHTPRNLLGAERRAKAFAGGEAEGWHAPALDATSPAPVPWPEPAGIDVFWFTHGMLALGRWGWKSV